MPARTQPDAVAPPAKMSKAALLAMQVSAKQRRQLHSVLVEATAAAPAGDWLVHFDGLTGDSGCHVHAALVAAGVATHGLPALQAAPLPMLAKFSDSTDFALAAELARGGGLAATSPAAVLRHMATLNTLTWSVGKAAGHDSGTLDVEGYVRLLGATRSAVDHKVLSPLRRQANAAVKQAVLAEMRRLLCPRPRSQSVASSQSESDMHSSDGESTPSLASCHADDCSPPSTPALSSTAPSPVSFSPPLRSRPLSPCSDGEEDESDDDFGSRRLGMSLYRKFSTFPCFVTSMSVVSITRSHGVPIALHITRQCGDHCHVVRWIDAGSAAVQPTDPVLVVAGVSSDQLTTVLDIGTHPAPSTAPCARGAAYTDMVKRFGAAELLLHGAVAYDDTSGTLESLLAPAASLHPALQREIRARLASSRTLGFDRSDCSTLLIKHVFCTTAADAIRRDDFIRPPPGIPEHRPGSPTSSAKSKSA